MNGRDLIVAPFRPNSKALKLTSENLEEEYLGYNQEYYSGETETVDDEQHASEESSGNHFTSIV